MAEYSWLIDDIETLSTYTKDGYTRAVLNQAVKAIRKLSADVVPVRHGRWNRKEYSPHESRDTCSECGAIFDRPTDSKHWLFCPHCGARLDLEADDGK